MSYISSEWKAICCDFLVYPTFIKLYRHGQIINVYISHISPVDGISVPTPLSDTIIPISPDNFSLLLLGWTVVGNGPAMHVKFGISSRSPSHVFIQHKTFLGLIY